MTVDCWAAQRAVNSVVPTDTSMVEHWAEMKVAQKVRVTVVNWAVDSVAS